MCEGGIKKHFTQMTKSEIWYLKLKINNIKIKELSNHVLKRMNEKSISEFEIRNTLKDYSIIEYHRVPIKCSVGFNIDDRALIRSNKAINGYHTVISISLNNGYIITGYKNMSNDNHRTINWSNYNKDLNILDYILKNKNELEEM